MNITDSKNLPPITEEQKEVLVRALKAGRIPWSNALMKRAGIKYEDIFPDGMMPPMVKAQHDVELGYVEEKHNDDPADRYIMMIHQLAMMHGYKSEFITEKMTTSETFRRQVDDVVETIKNGGTINIMLDDLNFLKEK